MVDRLADRVERGVTGVAGLGHDDHRLFTLVAVLAEGDDVAGSNSLESADGALDVLGEHVAPSDDDDVLDATAEHEFAVEHVGEIASAEPSVVEEGRCRVVALVVAGRDRCAAQEQLTDMAFGDVLAGVGIDHAHLEAGHGGAEQRQAARPNGEIVGVGDLDRLRDARAFSTSRSTVSHRSPCPRRGKVPAMATSAMPKAGKNAPSGKPNRSAAVTNASTAFGSTGSAPLSAKVSDERSRPSARRRARVASTHEKFGPAVAVPLQSEIHCIQLPGWAMKSCGAA